MEARELITELKALGMSQREIGEECKLSQGSISHIETGRTKSVMLTTQQALESLYVRRRQAVALQEAKNALAGAA